MVQPKSGASTCYPAAISVSEQTSREFSSSDSRSRAENEAVQITRAWAAISRGAGHCAGALPTQTAPMTVQAQQVATLIQGQRDGILTAGDFDALDTAWRRFMARQQDDISRNYEIMHDPF